eukprot:CAMPEP_0178466532 /NCGR_PEP_ID=MMETSP0689_2-20121128/51953_1 /TAXON_ID=160604 /ORGANISM="Amphidinium massartii, Strain CS-259" /LENGTH=32 /DNA_ID= /DNA_START= /DNA_END= /DNA_ORIENTATION=
MSEAVASFSSKSRRTSSSIALFAGAMPAAFIR